MGPHATASTDAQKCFLPPQAFAQLLLHSIRRIGSRDHPPIPWPARAAKRRQEAPMHWPRRLLSKASNNFFLSIARSLRHSTLWSTRCLA